MATPMRYPAIRVSDAQQASEIVLFAAKATDIDRWSGVPQKKELGGVESTGFQRELNENRVREISQFLDNPENIIQNPLLCAERDGSGGSVRFEPLEKGDGTVELGEVVVDFRDLESLSLRELLEMTKNELESRINGLADAHVSSEALDALRTELGTGTEQVDPPGEPDEYLEDATAEQDNLASAAFADESHIFDFWQEIAVRLELIDEIEEFDDDQLLGYSKDSLIQYLKPVLIVDGQHRLMGALASARDTAKSDPAFQARAVELLEEGHDPKNVDDMLIAEAARTLPVSLLLDAPPEERVFQFIVVNQKATPIGRALLGTIVSTTLANEELERVQHRLVASGIPLEDSRAVAAMTRDKTSPFHGLVERGIVNERKADLLAWSVLASLIRVFRELSGGKLYGDTVDYADVWRRRHLPNSDIVANFEAMGFETRYEYWSSLNGPWRDVFTAFWTSTRDFFADLENDESFAYWGKPRRSNLFNKVSLSILGSDFFQFLCERALPIKNVDEVDRLVATWLEEVSRGYFNRDWNLSGTKKDSAGIRKKWATLWTSYRKDPRRLPRSDQYRISE